MITLYQPAPAFGIANSSPFCMKLEAFLQWTNIAFTTKAAYPALGPYKKVPFVDYQSERLGDSTAIINRLLADHQIIYDNNLELGTGLAMQRLAEDHLYWAMVYFRWTDPKVWPTLKAEFFGKLPIGARQLITKISLKQAKQALHSQGFGRWPAEMVKTSAEADLQAMADLLATREFVCGTKMTHYDLAVWSVLKQLISATLVIQISAPARAHKSLQQYIERVEREIAKGFNQANHQLAA